MTHYIYPQNLKAAANMWLWSLRDFAIMGVAALISIVILVELHLMLPAAATLCYGFLTIRMDDTTILDYIRYAVTFSPSTVPPSLIMASRYRSIASCADASLL